MQWIRGLLYIVVILAVGYLVKPLVSSLIAQTSNRNDVIMLVLFVVFGPLVAGWLCPKVVNLLFKNWSNVSAASKWESRIVRELAPDSSHGFPVVLVPWPSDEIKSLAILANTYESPDGEGQLASVYIPGTPNPSSGFLRVVSVDRLVYTDWALRDLLQHHFSFGSTGPRLIDDPGVTSGEQ